MRDVDPDFADYVRARQQHLLRIAVLMCGDLSQAEDLLQESLITLSKHWHKVRDGHPDAYTRRILYTQNISRWRKRRLEVVREDPPEVAGLVLTDTWVDYEDVRGALAQVPPRQRAVLVLRYFEDLSEAETGADPGDQPWHGQESGACRAGSDAQRARRRLGCPSGRVIGCSPGSDRHGRRGTMNERDRRDVSDELRSAADVQLTKDYTA